MDIQLQPRAMGEIFRLHIDRKGKISDELCRERSGCQADGGAHEQVCGDRQGLPQVRHRETRREEHFRSDIRSHGSQDVMTVVWRILASKRRVSICRKK